jgi:hypothetical protein
MSADSSTSKNFEWFKAAAELKFNLLDYVLCSSWGLSLFQAAYASLFVAASMAMIATRV